MQLVLPVTFTKHNGFETLVEGDNAPLINFLKNVLVNQDPTQHKQASQRICLVDGSKGAGKTHLLLAINEMAMRYGLSHQYLNISSMLKMPVEVMGGAIDSQVLCLDDIHTATQNPIWERGLFDVINQFVEHDNRLLLLASAKPVTELTIALPDLTTRLKWGVNFSLKPLSDNDKLAALSQHATALGLRFQDDALKYIITRVSRDMHALMDYLEQLDAASLQNKRKLTIPFIKSIIGT